MGLFIKNSLLPNLSYEIDVRSLVDSNNASNKYLNMLLSDKSSGAIKVGTVELKNATTSTEMTSNCAYDINPADNITTIVLKDWTLLFSDTGKIFDIGSIEFARASIGGQGVYYIYLNSDNQTVVTNSPYRISTPTMIRLLRVEISSANKFFSVVVCPDLSNTPKLLRSRLNSEEFIKVVDAVIEPTATQLKRVNAKYVLEGVGSLTNSDENLLELDNTIVKLAYVPDTLIVPSALVRVDNLDVTHYLNSTTVLPNNTFSSQLVYLSVDGTLIVQYSDKYYSSLSDAVSNSTLESFDHLVSDNAREYVPVAIISYTKGAVDLTDTDLVRVVNLVGNQKYNKLLWNNY